MFGWFKWQNKVYILRENGRLKDIVTWAEGCCLPYALVFAIEIEKMAMEGVEHVAKAATDGDSLEDYNEVRICTMAANDTKFCSIFRPNYK